MVAKIAIIGLAVLLAVGVISSSINAKKQQKEENNEQ